MTPLLLYESPGQVVPSADKAPQFISLCSVHAHNKRIKKNQQLAHRRNVPRRSEYVVVVTKYVAKKKYYKQKRKNMHRQES